MEYHAEGGGGSWYANRRTSGQLSYAGVAMAIIATTYV